MSTQSSIITRAFSFGTTQPILLRGNEWTQPYTIGQRWVKLRVGFLCGIRDTGGANNLPGSCIIAGVCSDGKSYHKNPAAFCGWAWPNQNGGTLTYNANSGNPYYSTGGNFYSIIRTGTTNQTATVGSTTFYMPIITDANPRRGLWIIDLTKSATTWTIGGYMNALAHCSLDLGMTDLYDALEQYAATPVVRGTSLSAFPFQSAGTYSELTYGVLNTATFWWNRWVYPLEIYGVAVYVLY